ncbi:MAG: serine/threonine-protein kinase, partial [Pseudomonadota bacterium]
MPAVVQFTPSRTTLSAAEVRQWFDSEMPVEIIDMRLLQQMQATRHPDPDVVWDVLAILDQNYRRGRLDATQFKRLKARVERHALGSAALGATASAMPQDATSDLCAIVPSAVLAPVEAPQQTRAKPAAAPLGLQLRDRFILKELLGEGGMSCVYRASDRQRESFANQEGQVAIKMLRANLATRPDALRALRLEYDRAQRLAHPSIIKVFDLDTDGDRHFITMELLQGELLSEVIRRLRPEPMRREQAWAIIAQLGDALAYAHERNVIHADIKPGNVMITHDGDLRLFDFGAAWLAQREPWIYETNGTSLQGATPTYASADRLCGDAPTTRDDIFSFCCLAYELLCGEHPYDRRPANLARDSGAKLKRIPDLSHRQWRALRQGLAFRREDRPADLRVVLGELGATLEQTRQPLLLNLRSAPQRTASRVTGLSMVLLGTLTFAVV